MNPGPQTVRCRTVAGVWQQIVVEHVNEFQTPGSALPQALVRVNNQLYVRKCVPPQRGARSPGLYDLLDNEIRAGCRLGQVYGARFPQELANLVGYDIDAEEPFALLRAYRGEPVGSNPRFEEADAWRFQHGVLRALQLTSAAGVVHGDVTARALRWDHSQVQLVDFESAERVGDRRRRGTAATRSPEQAAGTGTVDPRDDVWAASQLIRATQLQVPFDEQLPDHKLDPDGLRALLAPVFGNAVEQRPTPTDLLGRMRGSATPLVPDDPDRHLAVGHEMFEQASRAKRGTPVSPAANGGKPARRGKRAFPFLGTTLLVAGMIIGTVVAL
ncbi:hypothetical protein V5P93_005650 [Actinokineospora auranticolor]|uniref:Protein kinase domain-containing protein n=1 Tax=Actinokineospora auranticolor TaxID=155976 RepID=A0A2S6GF46_9PSEU|nr:hypothetical protein [Actinokineospora auranticolor]PPK63781.1 hypothetical protein CLV40_12421 [Actinokineospora auranticolor]